MAKIKTDLTLNWSLDKNNVYLYDTVEEYYLIKIKFDEQTFLNKSKDTKIKALEVMVKALKKLEKKENEI